MRQLPEGTSEGTHQRHQESEDLAVQCENILEKVYNEIQVLE